MTQPIESSPAVNIAFWIMAVAGIASAVAVVQMKDIFKSALFLALSLLVGAGFFVLLRAEFLAVVQVLIYVGAVSILIIFAILMTRDVQTGNPSNKMRWPALVLGGLLVVVFFGVIARAGWVTQPQVLPDQMGNVYANSTTWIGRLLVRDFVLPFEVASVVLLAAIVGALALLRQK